MKSNLLSSGFIAVAIHALALSLPLYRANRTTPSPINTPISLSIRSPEMPVVADPVMQAPMVTTSRPVSPRKEKPPFKETLPPERDTFRKKTPVAALAAKPDFSEEKIAKDDTKPLAGGGAVGTALGSGDAPRDSQQGMAALGDQQGHDVIVYARPRYKENPLPDYPTVARRRGYEGQTLLRVEVLKNGRVGQIEISASSGFEILDNAAVKSVKGWIFVPGARNGETIDQWVTVPVRFSLK
jgi:protein TonB